MRYLDKLCRVAAEATPGPWVTSEEIDGWRAGRRTVVMDGAHVVPAWKRRRIVTVDQTRLHHNDKAEANVRFIATFDPSMVLALLDVAQAAYDHLDFDTPGTEARLIAAFHRLGGVK